MSKPETSAHYERLGRLLRAARRARDITQQQLAEKLGRKQPFVTRYEVAARRLDVIEFLECAHAIGVDPAKLLRRIEKEMFPPKATEQTDA